jgi:hypothetical protein
MTRHCDPTGTLRSYTTGGVKAPCPPPIPNDPIAGTIFFANGCDALGKPSAVRAFMRMGQR